MPLDSESQIPIDPRSRTGDGEDAFDPIQQAEHLTPPPGSEENRNLNATQGEQRRMPSTVSGLGATNEEERRMPSTASGLGATNEEQRQMPRATPYDSAEVPPTWVHRRSREPTPVESDDSFRETRQQTFGDGGPVEAPRPRSKIDVIKALAQRFELRGQLGEGGMGVVYRARDPESGRDLALKVVHGEKLSEKRLKRFRREGEITAGLTHPGIVKVHQAGEIDGIPYLAYELVNGARDFDEACEGRSLTEQVTLARDVARALGYAHERGVVHRDIKPENILVDADGRARVADFGLAAAGGLERLTRTGAMLGTPYFMAPELFEGRREDVGPPTDVWAMGVILYRILTDELPFDGASIRDLGIAIGNAEPIPPRSHSDAIPIPLEAVCLHALQAQADQRYATASLLADDLDAWLEGRPVLARRRSPWLRWARRRRGPLLAGASVFLALLVVVFARARDTTPAPDVDPPTLELISPAEGSATWDAQVRLEGTAVDAAPWVEVSAAGETARIVPGKPFTLTVPLRPGPNRIGIRLVDAAGNAQRASVTVVRRAGPTWFARLPAERRPPLPLPQGLTFGANPGEYLFERDGSVLVWVDKPRQPFRVGAAPDDPDAEPHEGPQSLVTLTRGFFLGKYEVRYDQYQKFVEATSRAPLPRPPFPLEPPRGAYPAYHVTWNDASAYCSWARLRLPTEAEWEWAARGPDGRRYPWGNEPPRGSGQCNRDSGDPFDYLSPVGSFSRWPSPFGCLDMAGNVWEWVQDRWAPRSAEPTTDPTGPRDLRNVERIHKGGGWNSRPVTCRVSSRARGRMVYSNMAVGFRVALSP